MGLREQAYPENNKEETGERWRMNGSRRQGRMREDGGKKNG